MDINLNLNSNCKQLTISGNEILLNDEHYEIMKYFNKINFINGFNQPISRIPNNIKKICIVSSSFKQDFDNLPEELIMLHLAIKNYKKLLILHSNLLYLRVICDNINIEELPATLKMLICNGKNSIINFNLLPEPLEYLEINFYILSSIPYNEISMHRNLKELVVNIILPNNYTFQNNTQFYITDEKYYNTITALINVNPMLETIIFRTVFEHMEIIDKILQKVNINIISKINVEISDYNTFYNLVGNTLQNTRLFLEYKNKYNIKSISKNKFDILATQ